MLQVGDRVVLTRDTLMEKEGRVGTVVRKYVPIHCTGVWDITVRWMATNTTLLIPILQIC